MFVCFANVFFYVVGFANAFSYSLLELNSIWICVFHRLCPKGNKLFYFAKDSGHC